MGLSRRIHVAVLSFMAGVMLPILCWGFAPAALRLPQDIFQNVEAKVSIDRRHGWLLFCWHGTARDRDDREL